MGQPDYDRIIEDVQAAMRDRDVDRFLLHVSPEVDFVPLLAGVEGGGAWRGHEGVRRWLDALFEAWEGYDPRFSLLEEVAPGLGIFTADVYLRGRESGLEVTRSVYQAFEFGEDGLAVWWRFFETVEEARAALADRIAKRS